MTGPSKIRLPWKASLTAYERGVFTPDLVKASAAVLDFLMKARRLPGFDISAPAYTKGLIREYVQFLVLQNETEEELVPSTEIQAVWFSHMLQSCPYQQLVEFQLPRVFAMDHPAVRGLEPAQLAEKQARTKELWNQRYPPAYNPVSDQAFTYLLNLLEPDFTPETIIYDRDWILEFKKFTYSNDVESKSFLEKAHLGYQKFMHLKWKHSTRVEDIGFSPCPSIDLFWHTHLLHPLSYDKDMKRLMGVVPKHKLLSLADRTKVFMHKREDQQMDIWNTEFRESIFEYATA